MVTLLDVGGLLLAFFLVLMNGLFVAAEFAFVKLRPTRVNAMVERGRPGAGLVQDAIEQLDDYLAVSQLGITLASLGLGWIGEPAVAALLEPVIGGFVPEGMLHLVSFAIGFGFITFLHVVFGELAPKTFAIQEAEKIALVVAPFMKFFYYVFKPGLVVFNGTANWVTGLVGVSPASESEEIHSESEIRMILSRAEETGHVDLDEVEMIESVFELGDTAAREVMVPRPDVQTLPASMALEEIRGVVAAGAYTRYLVLDDDGDTPVGFVHAKDVLRAIESETDATAADREIAPDSDGALTARDLARDVLVVPETRGIDDILGDFQSSDRGQLAVVVDEWGVFEGIVTIEDVLEEIVGDIEDEFDPTTGGPRIERRPDGSIVVDGGVPVQDVNDALSAAFEHDEVETIAGFVFAHIGHVPEAGDRLERDGFEIEIDAVDDTRIEQLTIRETASSGSAGDADSDGETTADENPDANAGDADADDADADDADAGDADAREANAHDADGDDSHDATS